MPVGDSARGFCSACLVPLAGGPYCAHCGARQPQPTEPAERDAMIGRMVADRYEVVELVNAGGMGRVYRAVQRSLERSVAIKMIRPEMTESAGTAETTQRFMAEARTAS